VIVMTLAAVAVMGFVVWIERIWPVPPHKHRALLLVYPRPFIPHFRHYRKVNVYLGSRTDGPAWLSLHLSLRYFPGIEIRVGSWRVKLGRRHSVWPEQYRRYEATHQV